MSTPSFNFSTSSHAIDDFTVVSFVGNERISRLFHYVIEIKAAMSLTVDSKKLLTDDIVFTTTQESLEIPVHGTLSSFNYLRSDDSQYHFYQATLVPKLWLETLSQSSQIYKKQTIIEIINRELIDAGLVNDIDFVIDTQKTYLIQEYVCQFQESNFNFISRLMEYYGIYYYFIHSSSGSKLVISDQQNYDNLHDSYPEVGNNSECLFNANPTGNAVYSSITSLMQSTNKTVEAVAIRDYDPTQPSLTMEATEGSSDSRLTLHLAGENISDSNEVSTLAQIRLEEINTDKNVFDGKSGICALAPGHLFSVLNHPMPNLNNNYLLVGVIHKGSVPDSTAGENVLTAPQYENEYRAILSDVVFRPKQVTPRPYFSGTQTGFIYSEQNHPLSAEIDKQGRYRVKLQFIDSSVKEESSCWMRMSQPGAGTKDGLFIPLKGGTEVLISFINGNPDLPVIQGALSNAEFPSQVTSSNPNHGLIATSGLLALKSDGGFHVNVKTETDIIRDSTNDFSFPILSTTASDNTLSFEKTLTTEEEMSGDYLVERAYGDEYEFRYGKSFRYLTNESEYIIGTGYLEEHVKDSSGKTLDINTISSSTKLASWDIPTQFQETDGSVNGLVEKTWGDEFDYHNGTHYSWSDCSASPNGGGRTVNFGTGYTLNIYDSAKGDDISEYKDGVPAPEFKGIGGLGGTINAWIAPIMRPDFKSTIASNIKKGEKTSDNPYHDITKTFGDTYDYHKGNELNVHHGETIEVVSGNSYSVVHGSSYEHHNGDSAWFFNGGHDQFMMGRETTTHLGYKIDTFVGGDIEFKLAASLEFKTSVIKFETIKTTINKLRTKISGTEIHASSADIGAKSTKLSLEQMGITKGTVAMRIKDLEIAIATGVSVEQVNGIKIMG